MLTLGLKDILISVLLVALIVLVIFLIVLVSKATDSIKKANDILDTGMSAADSVKGKIDNMTANVVGKRAKIEDLANTGATVAKTVIDKVIKK